MAEPIAIIGGGLAGLTLGIALRQREVPVVVWEAGHYPRHRVCGEFISGRGQDVLSRLGLSSAIQNAGIRYAASAAFYDETSSVPPHPLPQRAWCLSRFVLDRLLADEFQRLGGELKAGERWRGTEVAGIVRAGGRRVEPVVNGWRWIGLKIHARNVIPAADIELHFVPSGYVGLCQVTAHIVNVCGIFRSRTTFPDLSKDWRHWMTGAEGTILRSRLEEAEFDEATFCAVAGLDMRPRKAATLSECCIGDALTMIPPMTGNGMSIAFESAELAVEPLAQFSEGRLAWPQVQRKIARACDARFSSRLRWADWLQELLFLSRSRTALMRLTARSEAFSRALFNLTR